MEINFKATILIADDCTADLLLMKELLHARFEVRLASSGAEVLRMIQEAPRPDLIVLSVGLAEPDSWSVCQELKSGFLTAEIPVIVLTERDDAENERRAFSEGAVDCVSKPIAGALLQARVLTHVQLKAARTLLGDQHRHLEYLVAERTRDVVHTLDATLVELASLAEKRDTTPNNHIRRTQRYVAALARELRFHARFCAELTDMNIALLTRAAPLYDIGKLAVPDAILLKPGRLTEQEFEVMKLHTVHGRDMVNGVEKNLGASTPFLRYAREIATSHHEKWNGSGYPEGLKGEDIPISARLMAVADVYDALISRRVYKPPFTHDTAIELIRRGRGEHFDPDVVDAMLSIEEKFKAIAGELHDPEPAPATL